MRQKLLVTGLLAALVCSTPALGGFASPTFVPIEGGGGPPVAMATGDLNGDGQPDLVTANEASGNVSVLLGNGSGGFANSPGSPFPAGDRPADVALGDLDGDGRLDIVVANLCGHDVTILLNAGGGTFQPSNASPLDLGTQFQPSLVALGDVDGDGSCDLVAASTESSRLKLLRGDRKGGFQEVAVSPSQLAYPRSIALSDLDGDGRLDLVVANAGAGLTILLATAGGGFAQAPGSPVLFASPPASVAVGDVNGDGRPDIVAARPLADRVVVLLGLGGGVFAPAPGSPFVFPGTGPRLVLLGDTNRDGRLDIVTMNNYGEANVTVLLGEAGGGFRVVTSTSGEHVYEAVLLDADGDHVLDLVIADAWDVIVSPGDGDGGFTHSDLRTSVGTSSNGIATGDLDGDGRLDLVTANSNEGTVTVLLQTISGQFTPAPGSPLSDDYLFPTFVAVLDANRDGHPDILAITEGNFALVLLGDTSGSFVRAPSSPLVEGIGDSPKLADVDGDGSVDIVMEGSGGTFTILLGNVDGSFSLAPAVDVVATYPYVFALGDVTGDGHSDIVTTSPQPFASDLSILEGDGHGGFALLSGERVRLEVYPESLVVGDVNADGRPDILAASGAGTEVLLSNGTGGFLAAPDSPNPVAGAAIRSLTDLNGDGRPDLVVDGGRLGGILVGIGDGRGVFTRTSASPTYPSRTGCYPQFISSTVADLDGDERPDLAAVDTSTSRAVLLYNRSVAPVALAAWAGTPQTSALATPFDIPLRVKVLGANGAPVPDVVVTFRAPDIGASGTFPEGNVRVTDANGEASVPFTANETTGSYYVSANILPFSVAFATFELTNVPLTIQSIPLTRARDTSSSVAIAIVGGRNRGHLVVTALSTTPGLTVSSIVNDSGQVRATIGVSCTAPLGPHSISLQVSDGVQSATAELLIHVTRDPIPPSVSPPDIDFSTVNQSTCAGGGGASLASLQTRFPLQYLSLRRFLEDDTLRVADNCTASPARLPTRFLGVDITLPTLFPVGSSTITFHYRDDDQNVGTATGFVRVYRNGDLDLSGVVDVLDAVILASFLVGNVTQGRVPFLAARLAADVNGSGAVDVTDLVLLTSFLAGNVACLVP